MPLVRFELTISAGERQQTYALDRAATGTGSYTRSALKSPRQCPLVLLVKVTWRQVRASIIEGGIVLRVECCWGMRRKKEVEQLA